MWFEEVHVASNFDLLVLAGFFCLLVLGLGVVKITLQSFYEILEYSVAQAVNRESWED